MSVEEVWIMWCDGCGSERRSDEGADGSRELRFEMRRAGWSTDLPAGRDLCPTCAAAPSGEQ